jgi:hypothetical protein
LVLIFELRSLVIIHLSVLATMLVPVYGYREGNLSFRPAGWTTSLTDVGKKTMLKGELRGVASRSSPMSPVEGVDRKDGKISGALIADD